MVTHFCRGIPQGEDLHDRSLQDVHLFVGWTSCPWGIAHLIPATSMDEDTMKELVV